MRDLENRMSEPCQAQRDEAFAQMDRLAEQIAQSWRSPKGAVELIEEQRR